MKEWHCSCEKCAYKNTDGDKCETCVNFSNFFRLPDKKVELTTNLEKLNSECMYDMLCRMNTRLRENEWNDGVSETTTRACIMDCFMDSSESEKRCMCNCEKCISSFLNEEVK